MANFSSHPGHGSAKKTAAAFSPKSIGSTNEKKGQMAEDARKDS